MSNSEDEQHRHDLLEIHRRNARYYEQQIAQYGLQPPVHLLNALELERRRIAELEGNRQTAPETALRDPLGMVEPIGNKLQPIRSALVRSREAPVVRSGPRFRRLAWHTRMRAVGWWQAGGIAFALLVATIAFFLWRPAPNAALIDRLRPDTSTIAQTIILRDTTMVPTQIEAQTGSVVAISIENQASYPQRWLLFDGDLPIAQKELASGLADSLLLRRETALIQPGKTFMLTFVPPNAGIYSFVGVAEDGAESSWGVIEVRSHDP